MVASPVLKPSLSAASPKPITSKPKLGLRAWMERVLEECERADKGFDAEAVHDLRVALRRCRSLADGLIALDPDSSWKDMKKAGKKVFQALGDLRDMQVMEEWKQCSRPRRPVGVTPPRGTWARSSSPSAGRRCGQPILERSWQPPAWAES